MIKVVFLLIVFASTAWLTLAVGWLWGQHDALVYFQQVGWADNL